ncbi:MAG: HTH-type transcriptional regulator DmlR [Herbaspirillum frisingense]|uniref:HTH-type transcriptional regulator DmlR n=1 Tax=Herbaspirillum frisingense TaxID=92645 RepID=A0A7V8FY34_9BURK|nr:MAG: HTH-type transcriptional regulator DmlR [Herbaspirillum frisingense]
MKIENINDLKVVLQTAHVGSLTRAAGALGMTPSAASAALKRIEAQLNTRLFERSTRAMRLTEQGRILLDYAGRAFDLLAEAESQVGAEQAALVGAVRLAAPSDLTRSILLPWLNEFMAQHPGVELQLHVGDRPMDVVRDDVDLALRYYGELPDSRLVGRLLASPPAVLCAAPAYLALRGTPHTPQALAQHNCLTFMRGRQRHRLWRFERDGMHCEIRVSGDRSADDASLAHAWAVQGHGILLKTGLELRQELDSGALVPLLTDWTTEVYPLHALLPSSRFVPARVRALVTFLEDRFASGR